MNAMVMQLVQPSRVLARAMLLLASNLSQASSPALSQSIVPRASWLPHNTGEDASGNVKFITFDERSTIDSECTSHSKARAGSIDQNILSATHDIFPKSTSHTKSPQRAVMDWVANYLNVSGEHDLPCIAYVPTSAIAVVRHKNSYSKHLGQDLGAYDDTANTIYLPTGWTGKTFAETSMLVHQMVFHLQNLTGLKYECSWERESLGYTAQEQWLRLYDSSLWESFGIDRTIFLLSSEYIC